MESGAKGQIPLPDKSTRYELFKILLKKQKVDLSKEEMLQILDKSELYSGSDIKVLCKEAAMGPVGRERSAEE